jgi:hypothetical protein
MLVDIHIADVRPGQTFHYAGRAYVMVTDMDTRHPAQGMGQILALCLCLLMHKCACSWRRKSK